jgi:hypothetical protein
MRSTNGMRFLPLLIRPAFRMTSCPIVIRLAFRSQTNRDQTLSLLTSVYQATRVLVRMGVRVVVAGMIMFVDLDRRDAAVGYIAFDTLELDGGVIDAELLAKRPIHLLQDAGAL